MTVQAVEYNCWADVTDSGAGWPLVRCPRDDRHAMGPSPTHRPASSLVAGPPATATYLLRPGPAADHKPVYAVLEVNLPITDQAKKRAVCSRLLKECAAAAAAVGGDNDDAAAQAVAGEQGAEDSPRCCLLPDHVKLHPTTIPSQMVLLRNEGQRPLLFSVACAPEECGSGGATMLGRAIDDDWAAAAAAHQLLEVRPVRGVVPPGQDVQLRVSGARLGEHLFGGKGLV